LANRAKLTEDYFNKMTNVSCTPIVGSMFAFANVKFSPKAIEAAQKDGKTPDDFYCFELLKEKGIVAVAGSGFGQEPGTFHIRVTTLIFPESA